MPRTRNQTPDEDPTIPADDSRSADDGISMTTSRGSLPATLGRYRLMGTLGAGGMGVVLLAHDRELDRRVAIKLVLPGATAERHAGLLAEARALAHLCHPHVVSVFEVGSVERANGTPEVFIVMEYVAGRTLAQWSVDPGRGWREILEAYRCAGEGLHAAHRAGLVHGDVKPSNVLVDDRGRVVVIDFGLARGEHELASTASEN